MTVKSVTGHGKSIQRVAKENGTPQSIPQKRPKEDLESAPKMGRKPVLLKKQENELTEHLEMFSNM
jgi:hypothetical protein